MQSIERFRRYPLRLVPMLQAAAAAVILAGAPVQAEIYKWVDEDGVTQYTQERPPGGTEAETIDAGSSPGVDADAARQEIESESELAEEWGEERKARDEQQRLLAEEKAWREENCRRARQSVNAFSVPNALVAQEDGSRTRYTEEERLKGLNEAQERVAEYCK